MGMGKLMVRCSEPQSGKHFQPGPLSRTKLRGTLGKSSSWMATSPCKGPEAGATWQGLEGAWVFVLSKRKWLQV